MSPEIRSFITASYRLTVSNSPAVARYRVFLQHMHYRTDLENGNRFKPHNNPNENPDLPTEFKNLDKKCL
jgi:hypothetical protein